MKTFLIFISLFSQLLSAQTADKTRQHGKADVAVESRKKEKSDREDTKPVFTKSRSFITATEVRLIGEIRKAVDYLAKTERRLPKQSTARLEMLEKLVNLHLEQAVYVANTELRDYDKAFETWEAGGKKGKAPKMSNAQSNQEWKQVISQAEYVLKEFPRSKNSDQTLFDMGVAQQFIGLEKESARTYSQLIQRYPNSAKAGEAYFQLGDYYFDKLDFRNASNNYKQALKYRKAKSYTWALFKLGWCAYNLNDFNGSLNYWKQTVVTAKQAENKGTIQLKDEALRDMVFSFAELKQVEPAIAYYRANGGEKYIGKFLLLLSQTFSDQGKYGEAIRTLKRFQQVAPTSPEVPETQKDIVGLYFDLNKLKNVWAELENFPKLYGSQSRWAQVNATDKKRVMEVQQLIKDQILYYAKLTHKSAQKNDNPAGYAEAVRGYALYLKNYPNTREVTEVKYLMADILFVEKKYRDAGKLYLEVALMGKDKAVISDAHDKKSENIHAKVSRYMLDSYGLDFESQYKVLLKIKPDFSKPAKPLSVEAKNYVKACEYYKQWYPADKKSTRECDIYVTAIFYRNQDKENSRKFLYLLAIKYPNEKEGPAAVEELIPLYKDDKKALLKLSQELLKIPAYQKGDIGKNLRDLQRGAEIEEIGKIADTGKRAKAYEDQAKKNPKSPDADKLLFNAADDYLKAGMLIQGINAYMALIKGYPQSAQVKDSILQVAKLHEKRLDFNNASAAYLTFAKRYPKEKEAIQSVGKACDLQSASDNPSALNTCLLLAKKDPDGAKFFIARMIREFEFAKNYPKMTGLISNTYFKFNLTPDEKISALQKIYFANSGRGPAATSAAKQMFGIYKQSQSTLSSESTRYIAEMIFNDVNSIMAKYQAVKLVGGSVDNLANSIQKKAQMIPAVQKNYDQVLATKNPYWGVAALYQLGYSRELLALELSNPPAIKGASPEDVKKQLAGDANSARAEAKKFYEQAIQSIEKFQVYNQWAARSVSGLARINGQKVTFDDIVVIPDFIGGEVPSDVASGVVGGNP